ncbi:MAG: hypothetical protein ACLQVX_00725 [Limisphaerales bacterium]
MLTCMKTVSIEVDEGIWQAAQEGAARAQSELGTLLKEYLERLADGSAVCSAEAEEASRKRLLQLLQRCSITLDGRPTRESIYTDRRFH